MFAARSDTRRCALCNRHLASRRDRAEHRFDVNDRCAIDGFDWSDPQPAPEDFSHGYGMEANWIWPIRGSRREDPGERTPIVRAGSDVEHVTVGLVKPRQDDDLVANRDTVEPLCQRWAHLEPRIGRALPTLFRCLPARLQARADDSDWVEALVRAGQPTGFPLNCNAGHRRLLSSPARHLPCVACEERAQHLPI